MSSSAERVADALERFEQALRSADHPLLEALQPGLTTDEIHRAVAPTGLALPDEALELWQWRDGVDPAFTATSRVPGSELLPGGVHFLPIDAAVRDYLRYRDENWFSDDRPDLSPEWFPFAVYGHGDLLWVDCSGIPSSPAPLICWYLKDYNPPDDLATRTVASVARGIEITAALVERRIWTLVRPGDTVTFGGTSVVIADDAIPRYDWARDRDNDLPARWP